MLSRLLRLSFLYLALLCALAGPRQAGASAGLRAGVLLAATELDDDPGLDLRAFVRRRLARHWQAELNAGYGRLQGARYATDAALGEARLLLHPGSGSFHLYAGLGALRYEVVTSPPRTTPDARPKGWGATLPLGLGFWLNLGAGAALEVQAGYAYTLRDDLNRAVLEKGNDNFWSMTLGLALGKGRRPDRAPALPAAPPLPAPAPDRDQDGDGLSDAEETRVYFTNPVMADSDGDGLSDREEILTHRTNPNYLDTDGGGIRDGDEVARGADPLDPGDDFVPVELLKKEPPPPPDFTLPVVFFPSGGLLLVREARQSLDQVAAYLHQRPALRLELRGHSDSIGGRGANLSLSEQRAQAVRQYLIDRGIDPERLLVKALGESQPLASNATPQGRLQNRRVELVPVE
jgi:outer membrane protein OmpA-like peptidoglycan-associated protein